MFKERKTKFTLLSLLSALVVASTAFVGISIYAQTDDGDLTTFEEEEMASEETRTSDNATDDGSTSTADLSFLDGLVVCNVGSAEVSERTQTASTNSTEGTPTVSVTVMSETEVAELAANETETAAETSIAAAGCVQLGGDGATSSSAADEANATSTASSNVTSNATSGNVTATENATSTESTEAAQSTTDTGSVSESDRQILVIEGQDFAPGEVVLMWTENALVGIDDVDDNGEIEAKVPMPEGETAVAGNETATTELRFVESGTLRTATFEFDGETLTAAEDGDIEAAGSEDNGAMIESAQSGNTTSTNNTSTSNSTGSNYTMQ